MKSQSRVRRSRSPESNVDADAFLARADHLRHQRHFSEARGLIAGALSRAPNLTRAFDLLDAIDVEEGARIPEDARWEVVSADAYRRGATLGHGGFGQATLAEDLAGRSVVTEELFHDDLAERFKAEARVLLRLQHESIVGVLELGRLPEISTRVLRREGRRPPSPTRLCDRRG